MPVKHSTRGSANIVIGFCTRYHVLRMSSNLFTRTGPRAFDDLFRLLNALSYSRHMARANKFPATAPNDESISVRKLHQKATLSRFSTLFVTSGVLSVRFESYDLIFVETVGKWTFWIFISEIKFFSNLGNFGNWIYEL